MEKFCRKGHPGRNGKRWLALLMSLCLMGTTLPISARAENGSQATGLCEHHTGHTTECGYVAPVEGHECGHVHDGECGYQEAGECTHVHTDACRENQESCTHVHTEACGENQESCAHTHTEECGGNQESCTHTHTEECGYAEGHSCEHIHDDKCGYVESSEGSPCTFVCDICGNEAGAKKINLSAAVLAVQALIDALPDAGDITEENFEEVSDRLGEIDTAKEALTAEESSALDVTGYDAAAAKMMELMGQAGVRRVALMSVSGFNFSLTGNNGATVKTINLNAAALRPNSTWSSGGNLVYFGTYNGNPVAYRVLSSPNTQTSSENYLLLDCDTTLQTMAFDADDTKNSGQTTYPNEWKGSDLEAWLNGAEFYAGSVFSGIEKDAIAETALAEQSGYSAGNHGDSYQDYSAQNHVFCLSAAEADGLYADHNARRKTGRKYWWLRSAHSALGSNVGVVEINGVISPTFVGNDDDVSPALNVNLSSVLFASENGMDKSSALAPVSGSSVTQWKLTLRDSGKTVNVTSGQNVERRDAGGSTTITVPYTYTDSNTANPVSQISVMITDKAYIESDAQILYYGALENTTITSGGTSATGAFTLPANLANQTCGTDYYAYIIAEDVNGAQETDYASAPAAITIPAAPGSNPVTPDTPAAPVKGKGLGVSIIADPTAPAATTDAWKGSYVYFGTYNSNPVKYRVLDRTTTDFGGTTMLLDCDSILWKGDNPSSKFDDSSNVWSSSYIKKYLNSESPYESTGFLSGSFTNLEQTAIAASSKASPSTTDGNGVSNLNYAALSNDKIFLLDAKEVTNTSYGYSITITPDANRRKPGTSNAEWWPRAVTSTSCGWVTTTLE
ncbi:MAG: DUF6273 domain-containing protein [Enterocloster clostridioformis]|nr:DUF6273 domain-containing protein [Enterocloster clostridioformis]MCI6812945.1 DUF6273 domain-containing protein [Lachnospiraceae bacterium]